MPRERIPLRNTNQYRLDVCLRYLELKAKGAHLRAFCREIGLDPSTLRTWLKNINKFKAAVTQDEQVHTRSRAADLTLGGSGRIPATYPIEDTLRQFVKDTRCDDLTVSRYTIVVEAKRLMPEALEGRSVDACLAWCSWMLERSGVTIRRVTHSGRNAKADLEALRLEFADELVRILTSKLLDPHSGLAPRRLVFNMDQMAMFASSGAFTTVDVRGASKPGGDVESEVRTFADESVATFSVQAKSWFDERVMLEWIDLCWAHIVTEPCILILDSLTVHRSGAVAARFAKMGSMVQFVPAGATSVGQPLDVGVMGFLKHHYRVAYAERHVHAPIVTNAPDRRREMFDLAMEALGSITPQTVVNSFDKPGPYFPVGPALQ